MFVHVFARFWWKIPFLFCVFATLFCTKCTEAFWIPEPQPLPKTIQSSDAIVIVRIESFQADKTKLPKITPGKLPDGREFYTGMDMVYAMGIFQPPGTYNLKVQSALKGETETELNLNLPFLLSNWYGASFEIRDGKRILLFLKKDADTWKPTDALLPLIPLADEAKVPANTDDSVHAKVNALLLTTMSDEKVRLVAAHFLKDATDTTILPGLAAYLNDPNPKVRDAVLNYMAVNQQVIAIPLIVRFSTENQYGDSISALQNYMVPSARPYLLKALMSSQQYVRMNAITSQSLALKDIDRSSIPYLLFLLLNDDKQSNLPVTAFRFLRKFIPPSSEDISDAYFKANRNAETQKALTWWREELSAKHPASEADPAPQFLPANLERLKPDQAVTLLNPLLFERNARTRQQAIDALQTRADKSSIPYLLLALHDPDDAISYQSYRILHRVIATLPPPTARALYEAKRATYVKELFDWWRDEVSGKHFAPDVKVPVRRAPINAAKP